VSRAVPAPPARPVKPGTSAPADCERVEVALPARAPELTPRLARLVVKVLHKAADADAGWANEAEAEARGAA
jgi:hypothetical protein